VSDRCERSDLPPEMCSHCRGLDQPPPKSIAEHVIVAKYDGHCPLCSGTIREGEPIGLIDGEWLCAGCFTFEGV
jgi:hypothetical protein